MDIAPTAICPHCQHQFNTTKDFLTALNISCGISSPRNPQYQIGEFSLWFRGYMESQNTVYIRGFCVASSANEIYSCEAGSLKVVRSVPWEILRPSMEGRVFTPGSVTAEEMISAVSSSMAILKQSIEVIVASRGSGGNETYADI